MSIEALLESMINALNANTAALNGVGALPSAIAAAPLGVIPAAAAPAPVPGASAAKATKAKPVASTRTQDEVVAAIIKIKDEFGLDKAKEVLAANGYAKMADIKASDFEKLFLAAEAKYKELSTPETGDGL